MVVGLSMCLWMAQSGTKGKKTKEAEGKMGGGALSRTLGFMFCLGEGPLGML